MLVWFNLIDFESYANSARDIKLTGIGLLKAVDQPAEMIKLGKRLKLVNQFHRRKLELAANELFYPMPNVNVNPGKLDNLWVVRWLDDIGMPQYKDSFARAGVDGRMLNNLTLSELQTLGITLEMHYSSFRRAIELLRRVNFEDDYFLRRPEQEPMLEDKLMWSNHRVMEWLHSIDLTEYTISLRGSGLHGALILLEPRFTSETLADLLNIPKSKKLLRRHLRIKFQELLTADQADSKNKLYSKDVLSHSTKYKPRKVQQMLVTSLPKNVQCDIGLSTHVCPRRILSSPNSTTLPRNASKAASPQQVSMPPRQQPSLYNNAENVSHTSTISNVAPSGKVMGGMASLDIQCS